MNKNSNIYIVIYATIMVVLVAFLLAFTALKLKPLQDANILNANKGSILVSLGEENQDYDEFISSFVVDANGNRIESDNVLGMLADLKSTFAGDEYPVFQTSDGRVVVPVFGNGLWNVIWGYVALEPDMNTISGIVLAHAGETPGLGAEIATAKHQNQYVGKKIFGQDGEFVAVKLVKGVNPANVNHEVDAISGGTKTCDGVSDMLFNTLQKYVPFFEAELNNQKEVDYEQ